MKRAIKCVFPAYTVEAKPLHQCAERECQAPASQHPGMAKMWLKRETKSHWEPLTLSEATLNTQTRILSKKMPKAKIETVPIVTGLILHLESVGNILMLVVSETNTLRPVFPAAWGPLVVPCGPLLAHQPGE